MTLLTDREIERELEQETRRGWRLKGDALVRELRMRDFDEALRFVERVGRAAVDYQRRPDMCISEFNHVRLSVSNLNHAGFTEAETRLAAKVNAILDEHHPEAAARG
jgi:pterin-4a-carbinolamine dehydratase